MLKLLCFSHLNSNFKDKRCSSSAARERPRKGRHLSVMDENNLKTKVRSRGSKSSCSDKEEIVTAAKNLDDKLTITQRGKVFYRSKESSKSEHGKSNRPNARPKEMKKSTKLKSSTSTSNNVSFQSTALQDATFIVSASRSHSAKPKVRILSSKFFICKRLLEVSSVLSSYANVLSKVPSGKSTTDKFKSHLHDVITEVKIPLPEGVLNIDMDEKMYEYSADVFDYLMSRENELLVPENFLKNGGVTEKMRNTLVDWLIQVGSTLLQYNSVYCLAPLLNRIFCRCSTTCSCARSPFTTQLPSWTRSFTSGTWIPTDCSWWASQVSCSPASSRNIIQQASTNSSTSLRTPTPRSSSVRWREQFYQLWSSR